MRNIFFVLVSLMAFGSAHAQEERTRELRHFALQQALNDADSTARFPVYLRGDVEQIVLAVREMGGDIRGYIGGIVSANIPLGAFDYISQYEGISYIEYEWSKGDMLSDVVLINNNVEPLHQGVAPFLEAYKGKDVILGFIDSGIELAHPDFQNEDGSTRVIALWDHTQAPTDPQRVPQPYNYGQEWTAEDINAGITNHNDQAAWSGHGSTVSGVGVGNGNATGDFVGVAPEADIIVVSSNFALENWTMTIAEAVEWIFARAEAIGKPVVINASLGTYGGSHDALDAPALHIDSLLEASPGRALVSAAGNANNWNPFHLGYDIPENDTAFTWFKFNPQAMGGSGAVFFEAWADVEGFQNTKFTIGADQLSPSLAFRGYAGWRSAAQNLNQIIQDTIFWNNSIIGVVQSWVGQRGDQYQIQMVLTEPFSAQYNWRFATTGGGRVDVWSRAPWGLADMVSADLPDASTYPPMLQYRMPDKLQTMVGSWACSDKVVTVANYTNQESFLNYWGDLRTYPPHVIEGEISINSSSGPTRDQRQKPDIAATGDVVLGSGRLANITTMLNTNDPNLAFSGMHYVNGGTSMASPIVAGTAALFFERCPSATFQDFKNAVVSAAIADGFTGALPGFRWGYGKLDAYSTLLQTVEPIDIAVPLGDICQGNTMFIEALGDLTNHVWSTGAQGPVLEVTEQGSYSLTANDDRGCLQSGSSPELTFLPAPMQPTISFVGEALVANGEATTWQWYYEGSLIQGATDQTLTPEAEGTYQVAAIGANGCDTPSEEFEFGVASVMDYFDGAFHVYPNPSSGMINIAAKSDAHSVQLTDVQGKIVFRATINLRAGQRVTLSLPELPSGMYVLGLVHSHGISHTKIVLDT